ncbi:NAD-dependent epimerase/dehydratase family protein [Pontivivens insulae]|uniref:NAD-dependent epimerase/dehydratase domain-containing protein n=1 Tax=Pontivivens insulae TaxID=1639689 RepID=A0A2R8A937_9RHOB|nr:NAD-dependent epimerase/dehydratase family protein [Pontivivens insulae]RED18757.1 dTDP-4-dehydrorhamnose reductase [Pontivivens insulae]SPF28655.1 hypothetical protein POI8812_00957 [Pontivivens insulae]
MPTIFILGAGGRMGRNAADAFQNAGWNVVRLQRPGKAAQPGSISADPFDATDMARAAAAVKPDVIFNGLNPPYHDWARDVPRLTEACIAAARATEATVILPGNVYTFGADMPRVLTAETPHRAATKKGRIRIEMEQNWRTSGVQVINLRAGDFIDTSDSGNWFESHMTKGVSKGRLMYPGPTNQAHAWAFLPDMARAAVALAEMRDSLPRYLDLPFPGYTLTGQQLADAIASITARPIRLTRFQWPLIRALGLINPLMRELTEMRYLWHVPHQLDGSAFEALLPDFSMTPLHDALHQSLAGSQRISTQTNRWSETAASAANG